jgi:cell surface protein SprA
LIQGAQNLFGVKAKLQFGKLDVTAIATTQRGKTASINLGGQNNGGQGRPFEIIVQTTTRTVTFFLVIFSEIITGSDNQSSADHLRNKHHAC